MTFNRHDEGRRRECQDTILQSGNRSIGESGNLPGVLLAGDVGGTKTLLGLFAEAPERPKRIEVGEFTTLDYDSLVPMIREFLKASGVEARAVRAVTFGVAGAVTDQVARLTNVPWTVDAAAIPEAAAPAPGDMLNHPHDAAPSRAR